MDGNTLTGVCRNDEIRGLECTLAVIGTGGPVKRRNMTETKKRFDRRRGLGGGGDLSIKSRRP
eukprot:1286118-Pyramimonas_sp.AAC.1